jgi:hypothetical protein
VCMGGHPSNPGDILGTVTFQSQQYGSARWTNRKPVPGSKCVNVRLATNGVAQCKTAFPQAGQVEVRANYKGVKTKVAGASDYAPSTTVTPATVSVVKVPL